VKEEKDPEEIEEEEAGKPYDAANPQHVRERRKREALIQLMRTIDGRIFMWDFFCKCGIYRKSLAYDNEGRGDPMETGFNEGIRFAGNEVFDQINRWCPELFILMARENAEVK
jgi:hypothetical protein